MTARRAVGKATWVLSIAFTILLMTGLSWVIVMSNNLRPALDDYCHARHASLGYFDSVSWWFNNWSGDLFNVAVTALVVGQPLVIFPMNTASAIAFMLTAGLVGYLGWRVVSSGSTQVKSTSRSFPAALLGPTLAVMTIMIAWWGYWWVPSMGEENYLRNIFAMAVTDWQTVNSAYVIVPSIVLLLWLVVWRSKGAKQSIGYSALGLIVGSSGPVLALTMLLAVAIAIGFKNAYPDQSLKSAISPVCAWLAGWAVGFFVSFFSPGSRIRSGALEGTRPIADNMGFLELLRWTFPTALEPAFFWATSIGTLAVFLFTLLSFSILIRISDWTIEPATHLRASLLIIVFSTILSVVARLGSAFSYEAYWHSVTPLMGFFLATVSLGAACAAWLAKDVQGTQPSNVIALLAAGGLGLALITAGLTDMNSHISSRFVEWQVGPAPSAGSDIESEWVQDCWVAFEEQREDLPERSLTPSE